MTQGLGQNVNSPDPDAMWHNQMTELDRYPASPRPAVWADQPGAPGVTVNG
jgi:hypothetical protein